MPASFVFRTNQGKSYTADTYFIFGRPLTINSVATSASPYTYPVTAADVKGTSTTNGINYNVYSFTSVSTTTTYTVNYTCANATTIYVLAVGGGGSGSSSGGGGGGAGGVVMNPILLPAGSSSITISVGAGGASVGNGAMGINGTNTTVTFTSSTYNNITAYGGGPGGAVANTTNTSGGSSGGWGWGTTSASTGFPSPPLNQYNNYGNQQGAAGGSNTYAGGGGGSGSCGVGANGGNGIQCYLPGISTFSSSGTSYSTYYWGGGGGGFSGSSGNASGNGGLGGGGGGTNSASGTVGIGGIGGINNGGIGGTGNGLNTGTGGGSGGINTGSGGGGTYINYSGAGGPGIVIIAFPIVTAITSNQSAVLPASIVSSGLYSATLNNATLSPLAYNTIKGAFACRLLNYNYFGPVMTLRHSLDTTGINTKNFYADVFGNLGTSYLGTGQSVSAWLSANSANTTYAYVTKWYGQGMDVSFNSATQYITTAQPIYDVANGVLNFGNTSAGYGIAAPQTNCYLSLPNSTFPVGDASFSLVLSYFSASNTASGMLFSAGTIASNSANISLYLNTNQYYYSCWNDDYQFTPAPANTTSKTTVSIKYVPNAGAGIGNAFVNGSAATGTTNSKTFVRAHATTGINNFIGYTPSYGSYINGSYGFLYIFGTALTDTDRNLVEATPYQYSVPPTIAGLSATQVTSTTFVLNWSAVANATSYILWINGSAYGPVTATGTVTPTTSGPWTLNLYAYNASNVLLATGSTGAV